MARGRMISRTLGSSRRFSAVDQHAGDLACFARLVYVLCVSHADDWGRLEGDAFTIKHRVFPVAPHTEEEFSLALQALHDAKLIIWYLADERRIIEVVQFSEHQSGLHKRTESKFPGPDGIVQAEHISVPEPSVHHGVARARQIIDLYKNRYFEVRQQPYMQSRIQIEKDLDAAKTLCMAYEEADIKRIIDAFLSLKDDHPKLQYLKGAQRTMPTLLTRAADIAQHLKIQGVVA